MKLRSKIFFEANLYKKFKSLKKDENLINENVDFEKVY